MNREQHRRWVPSQSPSAALQSHNAALYRQDRRRIDEMRAIATPGDAELIDLARLRIRYNGDTPFQDLKDDLADLVGQWGLTSTTLYAATRDLWARRWRPVALDPADAVGSGADAFAAD